MSGDVYVRRASGLVRNISAWDAMIFNIMVMAPMAILVYGVWASIIYPGAHLPTTALLAIPISIIIGLFYAIFSIAMPRAGGDYIWVSRILHPSIGYAMNFFLFMLVLSVAGAYIPWFTQYVLSSILEVHGLVDLAAAVSTNEFAFAFAVVYYLICAAIISRGAKATTKVLWAYFILVLIGLAIYAGSMLLVGRHAFAANFTAATGVSYTKIIEEAVKAGYPQGFLLSATLLGLTFTYINFLGFHFSVYLAGEIKEVHRSQIIAIVGAVLIFGLISWLAYEVSYAGMGGEFLGALSYLYAIGSETYPLGAREPFFMWLFRYAVDPTTYTVFMIGWGAMVLAAILTYVASAVRFVFAWAFDRVVPTFLSNIDVRYHSPYAALIFVTVVAIIFQALWLWTPLLQYFAYIVFGWMIMQIITSIAAIVFPKVRRDIWDRSPPIVRARIGPIPVLSILAVIAIILAAYLGYASISPAFVGELDPGIMAFTIGLYVIGFIIYFISSLYHRVKGIPLELSFKELPPE
ncbi:MAG: APC family permease [Nitrososphaerota archaeon]